MTRSHAFTLKHALLGTIALLQLGAPALAAPLALSTAPAGSAYKKPAPNVIVSVDDSRSMEASGMQTLRDALRDTFSQANVPDGSVRLAWQSMSRCFTIPSLGDCNNENGMRVLDADHRQRFIQWVNTLTIQDDTPSHRMLFNAGEYLSGPLDIYSAWASVPGKTLAPALSCRKAYNLFMTDGGWNNTNGWSASYPSAASSAIGNADGRPRQPDGLPRTLGDKTTIYDVESPSTRIYRDGFGGGTDGLPTFADLAFHYWATDLQSGIDNEVPPRIAHKGSQTFTSDGKSVIIPEFWNPKNDPATWQHMTTYTVGFNGAASWSGDIKPVIGSDTWTGGDYDKLMLGLVDWTDPISGTAATRVPELWHAALNSRGKFIPAPNATALASAFKEVLSNIEADTATAVTSIGASSYSTRTASRSFEASYSAAQWTGELIAHNVAAGTGAVDPAGAWGTVPAVTGGAAARPVSTATRMDAADFLPRARRVLSHNGSVGIDWQWDSLSAAQQLALNTVGGAVDALGSARLDFLRGDRRLEAQNGNGGTFRNRASRHGDIVNSRLWVLPGKPAAGWNDAAYATFRGTARETMVYVGANDGMLHGFSAADGTEKLAYVPAGVTPALSQLTSPGYTHRFYVDGSPLSGDVLIGGTWKTYLAGFLGAGGTGYFVLDVTNPGAFASTSAEILVVTDQTTAGADPDIGHIFSEPVIERSDPTLTRQIAKLNNGRWALITGNGVNSANEQAVLLIQYLDQGKELVKLIAGSPGSNGLGAPRLIDLNGDKVPDVAYAGDVQGNLWKFDLTSNVKDNWNVAFGGTPLFTARDAANKPQPITAAPVWLPHPNGGVMLVLGTGRNVTNADRADTSTQSAYGIYDNTVVSRDATTNLVTLSGGGVVGGRTNLVAQSFESAAAGTSTQAGKRLWNLLSNEVNFSGTNAKRGWYYDLPDAGERVTKNPEWFDGNLVDIFSAAPSRDGNTVMETSGPTTVVNPSYINTVNAITGAAPTSQIYAYEATTALTDDPKTASRIETSLRTSIRSDTQVKSLCPAGQACDDRNRLGKISMRPSWRQLQ